MQVKIHELAVKELEEAIEWYELQAKGVGKKFKESVLMQIKKIKKYPNWYLLESDEIYKAYIPKFPYKILFTIEKNNIITIWALSHLHRKPLYWQKRIT
ncbi:MAG: type II toxin-antitoxin system RelE/ParE family toxin [Ignavibacteriales bacterium]|nr:type II toxin-antitoxin system RelE/ParE family toxin [Ignavibacteriales bacterium]